MKRTILVLIVLSVLPMLTYAQEQGKQPISAIPDSHVVKTGDTLWGLSEKYYGDPFGWTDLWKINAFISDPHWIYPGQVLMVKPGEKPVGEPVKQGGKVVEKTIPSESLKEPEPLFVTAAPRTPTVDKKVQIKASSGTSAETGSIIRKLDSPRPLYTKDNFIRTGFITKRSELPKSKIIDIGTENATTTIYDFVVMNIGTKQGVKINDLYSVLAVGDEVKHPDNGKRLGVVVRVKGIVKVVTAGEEQSRGQIVDNYEPISENDLIIPYVEKTIPMYDAWLKADAKIQGIILAVNDRMLSIHINDILYIDKGVKDGVKPGDRFVVYSRADKGDAAGQCKPIGEIEAISVMEKDTAVMVISLRDKLLEVGDRVELSARCRLMD